MRARIRSFVDSLFRRASMEQDLAEELRLHIEERADAIERKGVDRREALRRARLEFGAVENYKERCREARGLRWPDELRQDLRYAIRAARRSPGVTVVAILSLALGIGANTAIFSILNSLLLTPLSVRDPGRLAILQTYRPEGRGGSSYPLYLKLREVLRGRLLQDVCASGSPGAITVTLEGAEPVKAVQELVTANYFDVLGIRLIAGQAFGPGQEALGSAPVAVLSERFWRRRLGADPAILGKTLGIGERRVPVIGIAGGEFGGTEVGTSVDVWSNVTAGDQTKLVDEGWNFLSIFARLGPTSRAGEIQAATKTLVDRIQNERAAKMLASERSRRLAREARVVVEPGATGISKLRQRFALPLRIVMGVVALVLLIACANITNLLLARAAARQREIATRLSLGAGPARLFRQFLTESLLLALSGGLLGLLAATWTSSLLLGLIPTGSVPLVLDVHLNLRVLLFTSAVSIAVGLLFGIVPALRVSRTQLAYTLRLNAASVFGGGGTVRPGKLLSVAQIALSTMLVFAAGLFVRTLVNLKSVDAGFHPEHVVTFDLAMPRDYAETKKTEAERLAVERLSALPGVTSASVCWPGAFNGGRFSGNFQIPDAPIPESQQQDIDYLLASPRFFQTMGSAVLAGRDFDARDSTIQGKPGTATVAIINESLARTYFPGRNPVGLKIQPFPQSREPIIAEIVGVVRDIRHFGLREKPAPALYLPMSEMDAPWAPTVEVRLGKDLGTAAREFQHVLAGIDPRLGMENLQTMDQSINAYLEKERLLATIAGLFGFVALVLAAVGLYGVMSYAVARRTKEFGLRMALGAQRRQVLDMILRDGAGVALLGVALGVPAALALSRLLSSLLFDVKPSDAGSLVTPLLVMLATAVIAILLPAWRATRVDPMVALRDE